MNPTNWWLRFAKAKGLDSKDEIQGFRLNIVKSENGEPRWVRDTFNDIKGLIMKNTDLGS